jgi:hypothetical protein
VIYLNIATKSTECHLSATTKSTCQKIIEFWDWNTTWIGIVFVLIWDSNIH